MLLGMYPYLHHLVSNVLQHKLLKFAEPLNAQAEYLCHALSLGGWKSIVCHRAEFEKAWWFG